MTQLLLPPTDYQRIFQVIHTVLEESGIIETNRACIYFASIGALILRQNYQMEATISAGCMALMVNENNWDIVVYGREQNGVVVNDENGFHAWVECNGWLIDFMSPIMGDALTQDGHIRKIPRRMMQKDLSDRKSSIQEVRHDGEFFLEHDALLAASILDGQSVEFEDLVSICLKWFCRPPARLRDILMTDNRGMMKKVQMRSPSIEGAW